MHFSPTTQLELIVLVLLVVVVFVLELRVQADGDNEAIRDIRAIRGSKCVP
jgi:hypothetical protein